MPFLRPAVDDSAGNWTDPLDPPNLYDSIDEITADTGDFIQSGLNPSQDIVRIGLSNPTSGVDTSQDATVRYMIGKTGLGTVNALVRLMENTTLIAEWSHDDVASGYSSFAQTLTTEQKAAVTNWDNLFIEIEANPQVGVKLVLYQDDHDQANTAGDFVSSYAFNDSGSVHDGSLSDPGGTAPTTGDQFVTAHLYRAIQTGNVNYITTAQVWDATASIIDSQIVYPATDARDAPGGREMNILMGGFTVGAVTPRDLVIPDMPENEVYAQGCWKLDGYDVANAIPAAADAGSAITLEVPIPDMSGTPGDWLVIATMFSPDGTGVTGPNTWSHGLTDVPNFGFLDDVTLNMVYKAATGFISHETTGTLSVTNANGLSVMFIPPIVTPNVTFISENVQVINVGIGATVTPETSYTSGSSYTAPAGSDRLAVLIIGTYESDITDSLADMSATWGTGNTFTLAAVHARRTNRPGSAVLYLREADFPAGAESITVTASGMRGCQASLLFFEGVDQDAPLGSTVLEDTNIGPTCVVDHNMTTATGVSLSVGCCSSGVLDLAEAGDPAITYTNTGANSAWAWEKPGATGINTFTWDTSDGSDKQFGCVAVELRGAGAPPVGIGSETIGSTFKVA